MAFYLFSDDHYFSQGLKFHFKKIQPLRWCSWTQTLFKDRDTVLLDASFDFIVKSVLLPICDAKIKIIIISEKKASLPPFFNEYPTIFKNESLENMTKAVSDLILNSPTIRYSPGHLTAQERIIIDMMRRQFSVDEISSILTIHPKTVSSHKNNALRKLKIHRLDQLFNKYRLCSVGSGRPYNT